MNAIRHNRIGVVENPDGSIDIVVPPGMAEEFKAMVKRGTNCYPNKHVEIMDFADRILGRGSYSGVCMKQEIYGYPTYAKETDIVSQHWDIPSEDKMMLAIDPEFNVAGSNQSNLAILRGVTWNCFWPNGCSDSSRCREAGTCVAKQQAAQKD